MTTRVWVGIEGSYSDMTVEYVFGSESEARRWETAMPGRTLEARELISDGELGEARTVLDIRDWVHEDGTRERKPDLRESQSVAFDLERPPRVKADEFKAWPASSYKRTHTAANVYVHVYGTDHDAVRKAFTERCAQAIAEFPILLAAELARREQRTA